MPPERFAAGTANPVTVDSPLKMTLSKHETEPGRARLGTQTDKKQNAGAPLPKMRRREDGIEFSFDEEPVRPRKCMRRRWQGNA